MAQERRSSLAAQVASLESQCRSQLSALQPMITENHQGWQRLIGQQKKLDSDNRALSGKLEDASRAGEMEAGVRAELNSRIDELAGYLQGLRSFLENVGQEPTPVAAPRTPVSPVAPASSRDSLFDEPPL